MEVERARLYDDYLEATAENERLIDDLLSLSRIELNAHRRPDTPVDLVPIIRQVADGLQTLARDRGVTAGAEEGREWICRAPAPNRRSSSASA